jgi:hypothetical protein
MIQTRSSKCKASNNDFTPPTPAAAEVSRAVNESPIKKRMIKAWENLQQQEAF